MSGAFCSMTHFATEKHRTGIERTDRRGNAEFMRTYGKHGFVGYAASDT
jgi:hypothetical protein